MRITFLQVADVCKKMRNVFQLNSECYFTVGKQGELICSVVDLHFKGCLAFVFRDVSYSPPMSGSSELVFMLKCEAWSAAMDVLSKTNGRAERKKHAATQKAARRKKGVSGEEEEGRGGRGGGGGGGRGGERGRAERGRAERGRGERGERGGGGRCSSLWLEIDTSSSTVAVGVNQEVCAQCQPHSLKSSFFADIYQTERELLPVKWCHKITIHSPMQFDSLCRECCELNEMVTLEVVMDRFICRSTTAPDGPGCSTIEFIWPTHAHQKLLSLQTTLQKTENKPTTTTTTIINKTIDHQGKGTYALRVLRACTEFCNLIDHLVLFFAETAEEPLYLAGYFKNKLVWVSRLFREI